MSKSRVFIESVVWSGILIVGAEPARALGESVSGGGVIVEIRPLPPQGVGAEPYPAGTVIDGNTITLPHGGTRVWLSVFINWSPHRAHNFQGTLDPAGLSSGSGAPLVGPLEACTQQTDCTGAYGEGSVCASDSCEFAFYDCVRADSVCELFSIIPFAGLNGGTVTYGWVPLPGFPDLDDPGFPVYTGTLVLEVPEGALGTYTLDLLRDAATFFIADTGEVPISAIQPAQVVVAEPETGFASIVPVQPLGSSADPYPVGTTIDGNTITLPSGGTKVWFDVFIGGWAPLVMDTVHAEIDHATFASGSGAPLTVPSLPCGGDAFCEAEFGPTSTCDTDCKAAFFDASRSTLPSVIHVALDEPLIQFGLTKLPSGLGVEDLGAPILTASFVLDVPVDAAGTYTIGPLGGVSSFLISDAGEAYSFAAAIPGVVVVSGSCCLPGGACMTRTPAECESQGGAAVGACLGDCDGNGRDNACEMWADCNGNGIPDTCDVDNGSETDCNINGVLDSCEIAGGADDCDTNGVLDECEIDGNDCNANGILDTCETEGGLGDCNGNGIPDFCDLGAGLAVDCNDNGVLDACDIADGTSPDVDGNCIPDECDQNPTPLAEVDGLKKSRFISFVPVNAGCNVAIRVKFISLTPPGVGDRFASFEESWRWLGPPISYPDVTTSGVLPNTVSRVQCDPHFMEWGPVGLIHTYGPEVMPESIYDVQFFDGDCGDVDNPACYSAPVTIHTGRWGDSDAPFFDDPGDPGTQPDIRDVAATVRRFVGESLPPKNLVDLEPDVINVEGLIDFKDISMCVETILFHPYPFDGPTACP